MIQEYVPGKQVTLAHLIANPGKDLFKNWDYQIRFPRSVF
jgi:ethanolamine utilization protein EutS